MNLIEALLWCEKVSRLCEKNKGWGGNSRPRPQTLQQQTKQDNKANTNELPLLKTTSFKSAKLFKTPQEGKRYLLNCKKLGKLKCFYLGGVEIDIDEIFIEHLDEKKAHQRDKRLKRAKFIIQTIMSPQEIWLDTENGRRTLIGQYKIEGSTKVLTMIVVLDREMDAITAPSVIGATAQTNRNWVDSQRKEILEYKDGKKVS